MFILSMYLSFAQVYYFGIYPLTLCSSIVNQLAGYLFGFGEKKKKSLPQIIHPHEQVGWEDKRGHSYCEIIPITRWFWTWGSGLGILSYSMFFCFNFCAQYGCWVFILHLFCAISQRLARQTAAHISSISLIPPRSPTIWGPPLPHWLCAHPLLPERCTLQLYLPPYLILCTKSLLPKCFPRPEMVLLPKNKCKGKLKFESTWHCLFHFLWKPLFL